MQCDDSRLVRENGEVILNAANILVVRNAHVKMSALGVHERGERLSDRHHLPKTGPLRFRINEDRGLELSLLVFFDLRLVEDINRYRHVTPLLTTLSSAPRRSCSHCRTRQDREGQSPRTSDHD